MPHIGLRYFSISGMWGVVLVEGMSAGLNAGGADTTCFCSAAVCDTIAFTPSVKSCIVVIRSTIRVLASSSCLTLASGVRQPGGLFITADISDMRISATFSRCLIRLLGKAWMLLVSFGFGAAFRFVSPRALFSFHLCPLLWRQLA